ncbi:MAG: hypothetical protein M3436_09695, partial [Pseudomonadota bacterium]|nr:hypothetical protein [Pseudomonadota bacterium]
LTHGCDHTIDASVFGGAVFPPYRKSAHRVSSKRLPSRAVIQLIRHSRASGNPGFLLCYWMPAFHPRGAKQGRLRPRPASLALGYSPLALAFAGMTGTLLGTFN